MRRYTIKNFATGFLTATMIFAMSNTTFAASFKKSVELSYNNIKIVLNGKAVTPTDANGKTVEPFIIDGTTYLPVRGIANALNLEVSWDSATSTVTLKNAKPVEPFNNSETSTVTMGQKNALSKAKSYLSFSAFSYKKLIEQLEYEKFSNADAVYAADNCGADWNEQASKKAESYLSFSAFSRDKLIQQLEHDGFTNEQAVYGAEANGY